MTRPRRRLWSRDAGALALACFMTQVSPLRAQTLVPPLRSSTPSAPPTKAQRSVLAPASAAPVPTQTSVGEAPNAPTQSAAQGGPPAPVEQEVRFKPEAPSLKLFSNTGAIPVDRVTVYRNGWWSRREVAPYYSLLCDGPCSTRLAPGIHRFGLSKDGMHIVVAPETVTVEGPLVVGGSYSDRSALRLVGSVVGIAGVLAGATMIVVSIRCGDSTGSCDGPGSVDRPLLAGGLGVLVGSVLVGSVLLSLRDASHVKVAPLPNPTPTSRRESLPASAQGGASTQGATLALMF